MKDATRCIIHPSVSAEGFDSLAVPVHRASTILFKDAATYAARTQRDLDGYSYGLHGTPTTRTLEAQLTALEGGQRTVLVPSGQAALAVVLLTVLMPGDSVLIPDTAYPPLIGLCRGYLQPRGIAWRIYPADATGLEAMIDASVKLIWMESPGSTTMEVQDVQAIVALARKHGILTGIDNTWATPLYFRAFEHGVDVSVHAATKYIGGHSDVLLGAIVGNEATYPKLFRLWTDLGVTPSSDDCFLGLRGLRTLAIRLERQQASALEVATWLRARPEVAEVLYPALPGARGHELWRRDFLGASSLFGVILHPVAPERLAAMLDGLELFGMGFSWGGFESLVLPTHPERSRTVTSWQAAGPCLRVAVGLEDPADLIGDLERGFARLRDG